jgi:hypothetical protein
LGSVLGAVKRTEVPEATMVLSAPSIVDFPGRDHSCAVRLELRRVRSPAASAALAEFKLKGSARLRRPQRQAMHLVDGRSDSTERFPAAAERHVLVSGDVLAMHGPRLAARRRGTLAAAAPVVRSEDSGRGSRRSGPGVSRRRCPTPRCS